MYVCVMYVSYTVWCVMKACTVVLRGANEYMLEEMDRALHDSLCVIKRMLESNSLVAGGGAVEVALSVYLEVRGRVLQR